MRAPKSPSRHRVCDRSISMPIPTTPSARFARDATAGVKAQVWVEEVIKQRLPGGDFASAFRDGQGLCHLVNAFQPGTISKVETSTSPFKQMANISAFIQACRTLGVREHALFETLDLFNENRLSQVVRCLFSLSEVIRTTMPHFGGPYLSTPDKPEVDPAVKAVVDIAKGILPAPGWGPAGTPRQAAATAGAAGEANGGGGGGSPCNPPQQSLHISLPRSVQDGSAGSGPACLSPAAHATGQLTYGVYEGGGTPAVTSKLRPPRCGGSGGGGDGSRARNGSGSKRGGGGGSGSQGGGDVEPRTAEVLAAQREVDNGCGGPSMRLGAVGDAACGGGGGGVAPLAEYAGSTLPVLNTPRACVETPKGSVDRMNSGHRTGSSVSAIRDEGTGQGQGKGHPREEDARRRREATARTDDEMEVALWIEGVTGVTFPGKFWSSLKDGVLLCKLINAIQPGLVPRINLARAPFPEMENIAAFLSACRTLGVAEHSLFDTKDLHEKKDLLVVVRCMQVLGATVQTTVPDFNGPYLGKRSEACSRVNARGLRKRLGKGPGARGGIHVLAGLKGVNEKASPADVLLLAEHGDPTATITPAESPIGKRLSRRREASGSLTGSGAGAAAPPAPVPFSPPHAAAARLADSAGAIARGAVGAAGTRAPPRAILEEGATNVSNPRRRARGGAGGENFLSGRNVAGGGAVHEALVAARREARVPRSLPRSFGSSGGLPGGGSGLRGGVACGEEADSNAVVFQVQRFVESNTRMPWRISGDMHESLRDGWQLALLANALRPGAVRRVHNSIQPAKHVQNLASFLIACRRMGVSRALLFDIEDLYANRSQTKVARTLLALRALAADPDFAHGRPSTCMGTSLLVSAAAAAAAVEPKPMSPPPSTSSGLWR